MRVCRALIVVLGLSRVAQAAPSQALPSDPRPPVPRYALALDVLTLPTSSLSFEHAPLDAASFALRLGLDLLGSHVEGSVCLFARPMANGLDGLYFGPSLGFDGERSLLLGVEVGYSIVWGALYVVPALGVTTPFDAMTQPQLALRLAVGLAD